MPHKQKRTGSNDGTSDDSGRASKINCSGPGKVFCSPAVCHNSAHSSLPPAGIAVKEAIRNTAHHAGSLTGSTAHDFKNFALSSHNLATVPKKVI